MTPTLSRRFCILALALAASGCSASDMTVSSVDPATQGFQAGTVVVTATSDGLLVINGTDRPVYLMSVNRETLALLYWAPCSGGPGCDALSPGATRLVPWETVLGYTPGTAQYAVFWWHVTSLPDGTKRPDAAQQVFVSR
ncbi:MAG: hypothetical protein ABJE10_19610 [bacterium]